MEILNKIQRELKAPKNQFNSFGKYNYRSCEDILEAVKPLLGTAILLLNDEIVNIGGYNYIKATVTIKDGNDTISTTAYARESVDKKGMDDAQITGATSSYARKYALNGLFCIDDGKDNDVTNNGKDKPNKTAKTLLPIKLIAKDHCTLGNGRKILKDTIALLDVDCYVVPLADGESLRFTPEEIKDLGIFRVA